MKKKVIDAHNITKIYKTKIRNDSIINSIKTIFKPKYESYIAVNNISLNLFEGENLAFLGPNGAGKSSLIKILCGIQQPDFGEVRLLGENLSKRNNEIYKKIGVVFGHKSSLWWDLPLEYSMNMSKVLYSIDEKIYKENLKKLTKLLDLKSVLSRPVRVLSLGERVKGELAMNLIFNPKVLFLDEPTLGLDINSKYEIRELLSILKKETGLAIFLTSHDIGDIDGYCDRVILVNRGIIRYEGDLASLKNTMKKTMQIIVSIDEPDKLKLNYKKVLDICNMNGLEGNFLQLNSEEGKIIISCIDGIETVIISKITENIEGAISLNPPSLEEILRERFISLRN